MKKIIILLLACLFLTPMAYAVEIKTYIKTSNGLTLGLTEAEPGTFYDVPRDKWLLGGYVPLLDYLNLLSLYFGGVTDLDDVSILIGGLGLNVNTLASMCHLNYRLPADLQLGVWLGKDLSKSLEQEKKYWGFNANVIWEF